MKEKGYVSSKTSGMKALPFYLYVFLLLTLSGCIEKYEADVSDKDADLLVVEGTICSGKMNQFVLSRTQPLQNEQTDLPGQVGWESAYVNPYGPRRVVDATVSVRGSDGSEYVTQGANGYYTCQIGYLNPDVEYYLHIETDGEVYESEPQKPLRTEQIADVVGAQSTPESNIDVLVTSDVPYESDKAHYYSWTYRETWEVHPDYTTDIYFDVDSMTALPINPDRFPKRGWIDATSSSIMVGASLNYEGQQIRRLKLYDIDRSDERLYHKYSGLVQQRAISKAEYEYEVARRQAGSEMGGLFAPQPSALPTNICCLTSDKRVIGFVGCSLNTSEYRFFFHPTDFSIYKPVKPDARIKLINCSILDCVQMVQGGLFLCEWFDSRRIPGGMLSTSWAYEFQLNVRLKGAYTTEPLFWRQDEAVKDGDEEEGKDEEEGHDDE
jgi:hypothetical protein